MFHGRKRSQRRELTPEELEKATKKLDKIEKINKAFLEKRANKEYTQATLEMTFKIALLSPDFDTVWNYRREIIQHLNNKQPPEDQYKFFLKELLGLVKLMKENPKSYTLWGHRQWIILEGLKIEKFMTEQQLQEKAKGGILNNEIKLCDKMLAADERNFHCWNYRSWVINTQLEQYDEIEKAIKIKAQMKAKQEQEQSLQIKNDTEASKDTEANKDTEASKDTDEADNNADEVQTQESVVEYVASEKKLEKLNREFDMTTNMIEKNFSNFSAWHYRSKLMIKIYESNDGLYQVPLDLIQSELEKIKHAIFTEPNDQSSWNYHRWLVSLLVPLHIVDMGYNQQEKYIRIQFSDILWDSQDLAVFINGEKAELISMTGKPESKLFMIKINENMEKLSDTVF